MRKIKIFGLYQVIMHYRLPFYERLCLSDSYDFFLSYGYGVANTKKLNTDISSSILRTHSEKLYDVRVPLPFTPFLIFSLIKRNADVIFTEGSSSLINASIAFLYSKIFGKKFIWWSLGKLEGKTYKGLRGVINKWEHVIELHADAIFTYSNFGKDYFVSRGVDPERIFVGVNVLDTEEKLKELNDCQELNVIDKSFFNIGFIGSIAQSKNLEVLIDSVEHLNCRSGRKVCLHLIGDGSYLSNIIDYIDSKDSVKDKIVIHGRINTGAARILKDCDVLVLPGLGGLAICEGMICSLPIITGKADGTEYDLVDETNGFILNEINVYSISEKLMYLINNEDIRIRMGENSFRKITEVYTFDEYVESFNAAVKFVSNK